MISLRSIISSISTKKVLVIGDAMLDHYVIGSVSRLSPEAPVPILMAEKDSFVAGGAANVALNLASLGIDVELCSIVGNDSAGMQLTTILSRSGVIYDEIFIKKDISTIIKTRVVAANHQICRIDREANFENYDLSDAKISTKIIQKIKDADAIIVSDYAKGAIKSDFVISLITIAKEYGCSLLMDSKPSSKIYVQGVDLLKPNKQEALELAGIVLDPHEKYPYEDVCWKLWERYRPRYLVITLGSEGMLLSEEGRITKIIPTTAKEVFDVSGAGDTTMAALAAGMSIGLGIEDSMIFANLCAGIVVGKHGTAVVSPEEILNTEFCFSSLK